MVKIFDYLKGKRTKLFGDRTGAFILALPTVPLRRSHHVDEALSLFGFWQAHFQQQTMVFQYLFPLVLLIPAVGAFAGKSYELRTCEIKIKSFIT